MGKRDKYIWKNAKQNEAEGSDKLATFGCYLICRSWLVMLILVDALLPLVEIIVPRLRRRPYGTYTKIIEASSRRTEAIW